MKKMVLLLAEIFFVLHLATAQNDQPYVVLVSMDGFRWDYPEMVETPNFDQLAARGVRAKSLRPCFPTKTFPNHYSIATGLYPDHHGIVLNSFFDPETERYYAIFDRKAVEDGSFYGGEPIWVTAEKQGMKAASYYWVGSEAEIDGYRPSTWKEYDHDFPYGQRIDSVISWLEKPEETRPHLILLYFDQPDGHGHSFGPESNKIKQTVMEMDSLLGVLMQKLDQLPIAANVNLIVTSDHGMQSISNDRKIVLNDHLNEKWIAELQGYNPNFCIAPKPGFADSVYQSLKKVEGMKIWFSDEVPERLHYGSNPRCLDFVIVADSGWSVIEKQGKKVGKGAHGYDNTNQNMHAIFYAKGPAFRENYTAPVFNNIDIYPLICEILELKPARVDGTLKNVEGMLK